MCFFFFSFVNFPLSAHIADPLPADVGGISDPAVASGGVESQGLGGDPWNVLTRDGKRACVLWVVGAAMGALFHAHALLAVSSQGGVEPAWAKMQRAIEMRLPSDSKGLKRLSSKNVEKEELCKPNSETLFVGAMETILGGKDGLEDLTQLLKANPSLTTYRDEIGRSLIFMAAEEGKEDCIARLAELKADFRSGDEQGQTPLFIAAKNGKKECISLLAGLGADINSPNLNYQTPISIATAFSRTDCIALLAELKADLNIPTKSGGSTASPAKTPSSPPPASLRLPFAMRRPLRGPDADGLGLATHRPGGMSDCARSTKPAGDSWVGVRGGPQPGHVVVDPWGGYHEEVFEVLY